MDRCVTVERTGRMPKNSVGRWSDLLTHLSQGQAEGRLYRSRWLLFLIPVLFMVTLVIGAGLKPEQAGLGTHRQLGLPACASLEKTGVPCPTCGMTTALANLARGRIIEAWKCNTTLVLMTMVGVLVSVWASFSFWQRKLAGFDSWDRPLELWAGGMFVIALSTWLIRAAQWHMVSGF